MFVKTHPSLSCPMKKCTVSGGRQVTRQGTPSLGPSSPPLPLAQEARVSSPQIVICMKLLVEQSSHGAKTSPTVPLLNPNRDVGVGGGH